MKYNKSSKKHKKYTKKNTVRRKRYKIHGGKNTSNIKVVEIICNMLKEQERLKTLQPVIDFYNVNPSYSIWGKDDTINHRWYNKFDSLTTVPERSLAINNITVLDKYKDDNKYVVIIESDAMPLYNMNKVNDMIDITIEEMKNNNVDFVSIGKNENKLPDTLNWEKITDTLFKHPHANGTFSYIISPNAVKRYLEYFNKTENHTSIDLDYDNFFYRNLDVISCWRVPEIFKHNDKYISKLRNGNTLKQYGGSEKIKFFRWFNDDVKERSYFEDLLKNCIDDYDEVHIHSVFPKDGHVNKSDKILTIQYSGEPFWSDPNQFDINIIPGIHEKISSLIPIPLISLDGLTNNYKISKLLLRRKFIYKKSKFCLFSVSNENAKDRIRFFNELTKYKKVDSCGKLLNNIGPCEGNDRYSKEYCNMVSQYKFMICFENTSLKNYLTEKLLIAYKCGAIPIYWGCTNIDDYINMDSILYLKPDYSEKDISDLINKIRDLDNDDELYKKKYESIFFKDGKLPEIFDMNIMNKKMCERVNSLKKISAKTLVGGSSGIRKITFLTYGNDNFKKSKERIKKEAEDMGCFNNGIYIYGPENLSEDFKKQVGNILNETRGGGYYIWKPYVIADALSKLNDNDYLCWTDCGCSLKKSNIDRFNEYIEMISLNSRYSLFGMHLSDFAKEKLYTSIDIFNYFNEPFDKEIGNSNQIITGLIIIRKTSDSVSIINKWLDIATNMPELFTDIYNGKSKSIIPNFIENRHDQSVFSMVIKTQKNKSICKIIFDETYGDKDHIKKSPIIADRIRE